MYVLSCTVIINQMGKIDLRVEENSQLIVMNMRFQFELNQYFQIFDNEDGPCV